MLPVGGGGLDTAGSALVTGVMLCVVAAILVLMAAFGSPTTAERESWRMELAVMAAAVLGVGIVLAAYGWANLGWASV